METKILVSVIILILINVLDNLLSAVKGPTLIFYVRDLLGDKDDYGRMKSVQALSSLIMTPVYGQWVDSNGGKYSFPYVVSFSLGMVSALLYFAAVLFPPGSIAIAVMYVSFFLSGAGKASRTLAYSWIATAIPVDNQRNVLQYVAMTRTVGTVVGPLLNVLVTEINTEVTLFGTTIPVNPYNVIGLMLFAGELVLTIAIVMFLVDPPEQKKKRTSKENRASIVSGDNKGVLHALLSFDMFFPVFTIFVVVMAFSLPGVSFSVVASSIGWTPVAISEVSAAGAVIMGVSVVLSMVVSLKLNPLDVVMIGFGFTFFFIGTTWTYLSWKVGVTAFGLTVQMYLMSFAYPFIGPSNRSNFTKAMHGKKGLEGKEGIVMSVYTKMVSFGSLIAPTVVATYNIRSPEEIAAATDGRYLNPNTLVFSALTAMVLIGLVYEHYFLRHPEDAEDDETEAHERTSLVKPIDAKTKPRASMIEISDRFSASNESLRQQAVEIEGLSVPLDTNYEKRLSMQLLEDKKLWEELEKMDEIEEVNAYLGSQS